MEAAAKYRKRPVEIEARRLTLWNEHDVVKWCGGKDSDSFYITIPTPEGEMRAEIGDYIIKGVKGEFYPCKPDIFEATYERVEP